MQVLILPKLQSNRSCMLKVQQSQISFNNIINVDNIPRRESGKINRKNLIKQYCD